MTGPLILAVDQGTTNTKAIVMNAGGAIVSRASCAVPVSFPEPGWVEQDADTLWRSVVSAIDDCLRQVEVDSIGAVAVTNQRESALVWERASGRAAGPVIVWQCRRTSAFCEQLHPATVRDQIAQRTGLPIDPLFSASKIRWLLDSVPDGHRRSAKGHLCAGTVDSWLLWNLSGGAIHACDTSNASRTQLLNLRTLDWDDELLAVFGIAREAMPVVRPSSGTFGATTGVGRLPAGIPIAAAIGDSHAALFGQAAFAPGQVKATYGTGSSLMTPLAAMARSQGGLATTVAWSLPDRTMYAFEGNITATGSAVEWAAQILGLCAAADAADLAASSPDAGGTYLVPAFAGLGAPYWDADARGAFVGITRGTTPAHLARASVESIAFQVRDVFDAMARDAGDMTTLLADGGAARNDMLMQFQADILGRDVIRSDSPDVSARGAAWLAGLATGVWTSLAALQALPRPVTTFQPRMTAAERARRYDGWRDAVARTRSGRTARREA